MIVSRIPKGFFQNSFRIPSQLLHNCSRIVEGFLWDSLQDSSNNLEVLVKDSLKFLFRVLKKKTLKSPIMVASGFTSGFLQNASMIALELLRWNPARFPHDDSHAHSIQITRGWWRRWLFSVHKDRLR